MQIHLPAIHSAGIAASGEVVQAEEAALLWELEHDIGQDRDFIVVHPTLMRVAEARAKDLATNDYFSHVDLQGHGPNWHVIQAGYKLPDGWDVPADLNYIESIAAGYPTAQDVWDAWLRSAGHRKHVLGESAFYAEQTNVGVGFWHSETGSKHKTYWVFISCPPQVEE